MNEDDTFGELVIGGLKQRLNELKIEWDTEMAAVNKAISDGDIAGMSPKKVSPILDEIRQIEDKLIEYHIRQMENK